MNTRRRHFLKGAGVALALPWLPSLERRAGAAVAAPKRFIPIYFPNGASNFWWLTTGTGAGDAWQLSPLLEPFEPVKQKMLMIRQLGNFTWRRDLLTMSPQWTSTKTRTDVCDGCTMPHGAFVLPSHSRDPSALLNCTDTDGYRRDNGHDVGSSAANAETADQLIARSMPQETPLASMQLGVLNGDGGLDDRHAAMSRNMSWSEDGTALGKDLDPRDVFDRLVAAGAGEDQTDPAVIEAAERRRALELSALDTLDESATALQSRLSLGDRERLDQYLTGVRELEGKLSTVIQADASCDMLADPGNPSLEPDPTPRAHVMNDLLVMALKCDVTRVATYMLDNSRSDLVYSWLPRRDFENGGAELGGTATSYHSSQHAGDFDPDFASINRWHIEVAADLLTKMDAVEEEDGTLLDNSLVQFSSAMHHGDHSAFDLPYLLFGSGGGVFRQNELIEMPEAFEDIRQLRDIYFTVLNEYFNLDVEGFGDDMRGMPNELVSEILA